MVREAERQWKNSMEQVNKKLKTVEFRDPAVSFLSDLEELGEMHRTQNQAPLDMVAELKAINERLDSAENGNRKQTMENRIWQVASITIGLLTLVATVLFGILGLSR